MNRDLWLNARAVDGLQLMAFYKDNQEKWQGLALLFENYLTKGYPCSCHCKRKGGERALSLQDLILTSSVSFTRKICSRRSCRSLNVDCAVIEYTRAKPWPFFMYKSLMAVNCSCGPAEGNVHDQQFYSSHFLDTNYSLWPSTDIVYLLFRLCQGFQA